MSTAITVTVVALLLAIAVIDVRERRIPNRLTYAGTLLALALAAFSGIEVLVAALLGAGLAALVMGAFYALGRGRLGMGDVKLCVFAGAVLGVAAVPGFLLLGTALGGVGAIAVLIRRGRHATFAYGPYLAAAAAIVLVTRGPIAG